MRLAFGEEMGKYEEAKTLKVVKGRKEYECAECGATINVGDLHAVERLDLIRPPPGLVFNRYCMPCYDRYGESLIGMTQRGEPKSSLNDFASDGP